jgi:hypothetical protein
MEHVVGDLIVQLGVRAFPTFHFYLEGNKVDEVQGGNIAAVEAKVVQHKASVRASFEGAGHSLGGGAPPASEADARAARLARFGGSAASSSAPRPAGSHPNAALNAKILAADRGDDGDVGGSGLSVKPIAAAASAAAAMDVDDNSGSAAAAASVSVLSMCIFWQYKAQCFSVRTPHLEYSAQVAASCLRACPHKPCCVPILLHAG